MVSKASKVQNEEEYKYTEIDQIGKDNNQKKRLDLNVLLKRLKEQKKQDGRIQLLILTLSVTVISVGAIILIF